MSEVKNRVSSPYKSRNCTITNSSVRMFDVSHGNATIYLRSGLVATTPVRIQKKLTNRKPTTRLSTFCLKVGMLAGDRRAKIWTWQRTCGITKRWRHLFGFSRRPMSLKSDEWKREMKDYVELYRQECYRHILAKVVIGLQNESWAFRPT